MGQETKYIVVLAGDDEPVFFIEENGNRQPQIFDTEDEAEAEIIDHLTTLAEAISNGDIIPENAETRDDYDVIVYKL